MFATGEERSPITIFKDFLWRCPLKMRKTGPLYLSCEPILSLQDYYKRQPMEVKKINDMMKLVINGTTLEESLKTLSDYSTRKTVEVKDNRLKAKVNRRNNQSQCVATAFLRAGNPCITP